MKKLILILKIRMLSTTIKKYEPKYEPYYDRLISDYYRKLYVLENK